MSDTQDTSTPTTAEGTGAAPGGGGSGGTSVGGSTTGVSIPTLPPQYSTADLGFFVRQTESVPTSVTVGPDGALYVGTLSGEPYPDGYASVIRIANPTATTGFNGTIASGVPQVYASGFSQIQSLGFDNQGDMYVLQYVNAAAIYDPTQNPADLPPSQLIKVSADGVRTVISGPELKLGNYLLVDKATGDVYVATNNADTTNGEVLRYHTDPTSGAVSESVVASGLLNPRGMAFGPDGNLYVLETGAGEPANAPGASSAPVIPFIPGLVSERGGDTGGIVKIDITSPAGGQTQVLSGLSSFREFNPTTGQDRVISEGQNGLTITPDGTVYIAAGGGLDPQTATAVGPIANELEGVLKVSGLFGSDPSAATVTPEFNSLTYAAANGPDGSTTLYNTESNLNDITVGSDGNLYAVDAARNVVYGLTPDGKTVLSATVIQKQPPVLTPPQYAATVAAGGNPAEQYAAEISNITYKNALGLPDVPGNVPVLSAATDQELANLGMAVINTLDAPSISKLLSIDATQVAGIVTAVAGALDPATEASLTSLSASDAGTLISLAAQAITSDPAMAAMLPTITPTLAEGLIHAVAPSLDAATNAVLGSIDPTQAASFITAIASNLDPSTAATIASLGSAAISGLVSDVATTIDPATLASIAASGTLEVSNIIKTTVAAFTSPISDMPAGPPSSVPAPHGEDSETAIANLDPSTSVLPSDPTSPSVDPTNIYANYFEPFFGNFAPAAGDPLALPTSSTSSTGTYTVNNVYNFGDRLADSGTYDPLLKALGYTAPATTAPYSSTGDFSDGPKWTTDLAQILGANQSAQYTNFAYEFGTAQSMSDPLDPLNGELNFQNQLNLFQLANHSFTSNDLVTVTFGGNDLTLPTTNTPDQTIALTVQSIIGGMQQAVDLGAKHFLVSNLPDLGITPLFSSPAFQAQTGLTPATLTAETDQYNSALKTALTTFASQTGTDVKELDLNALFKGIVADPASYGFSNVTQPILSSTPSATSSAVTYNPAIVGQNPAVQHSSLFLDPYFDPTALGQAVIAQTARSTLT